LLLSLAAVTHVGLSLVVVVFCRLRHHRRCRFSSSVAEFSF
jgi:hypothetical protein